MADFPPVIVASELARQLGDNNLQILDCRFDLFDADAGKAAYDAGHLPAAAYADLDRDLAGPVTAKSGRHPLPDVDAACASFGRLGIDQETNVVIYDSGGGAFAARAWWLLRWLGHHRVAVLDGGFPAWLEAGYEIETVDTVVAEKTFIGKANSAMVLTTAEVLAHVDNIGALRLHDARDTERFAGRREPIDAVAGHIPGSRSMPFEVSLQSGGRWRSATELKEMWTEQLGEAADGDWSVMCGSGVTACHLALSAAQAGLALPRLYVGSWSEWIRDPARPVASGPEFA